MKYAMLSIVMFGLTAASGLAADIAYAWDYNDFGIEVISYVPGSPIGTDWITGQLLDDPNVALGPPTQFTSGDGWYMPLEPKVPVVPVYPPFRRDEIVSIGPGGHLILKFNHRVGNDRNNPYGIDFIIFGNAFFPASSQGQPWTNGNPNQTILGSTVVQDPAMVSVSQDGQTWFSFENGPFADTFAPTAAFDWDPTANNGNGEWGQPLNPTLPLNPGLKSQDFAGKTVAQAIAMYQGSAGGTGFDLSAIPQVELEWIQYVKISIPASSSVKAEFDAVADVATCGDYKRPFPPGDLNYNCRVDLEDLLILAQHWLVCTNCQD